MSKNTLYKITFLITFMVGVTACAGTAEEKPIPATALPTSEPTDPSKDIEQDATERQILTYTDLITGFTSDSPLDEAALTMPEDAAMPQHVLEGRLELIGEDQIGDLNILRGEMLDEPEVSQLPEFNYSFIQVDNYLVPVQRGLIITDHPYWNYILEPGRIWQEEGDQGYSRASFPFALVWKGSNATANGSMTFLFNGEGISYVWYQITQETTVSFRADMWGLLQAQYHAEKVDNAEQITSAFTQELANRFPTKPIEQLAEDYPDIDITAFGRGVSGSSMTWYGFVANGVNYVGGCQTRYGRYPYCEYLRAPSYSTAKSAFVGVALMLLTEGYDSDLPNMLIQDYVPETVASQGDWSTVTFNNVLDMATGNYQSSGTMVDEEQWDNPFWTGDYYDEIITAALDWPNSEEPGSTWVYRTSDTFILTVALQNYLETQEGTDVDLFEFVVEEVYQPLNLGPGAFTILRTKDNNWHGQPYGGLGMWWVPDDLAKIANFMNVDEGIKNGVQILDAELLAAALQRNPDDRGVDRGRSGKYNNAFWADKYTSGYRCEVWVPQMLGYSGIVVVLFPNGTSYYYASDSREFSWDWPMQQTNKIAPFCP